MPSPYPEQRLLAPRAVLTGPGDPNSLENIIPDSYPEGALCFVVGENKLYALKKYSTEFVRPPDIIATIRGDSVPGRWSSRIAGNIFVQSIYFVDQVNSSDNSAERTGAINAQFRTIPEAIDRSVVDGNLDIIVMVAPGNYIDPIVIPFGYDHVTISGWANEARTFVQTTDITGGVTVGGQVGVSFPLEFSNVCVSFGNIVSDAANHDLNLYFSNSHVTADITGFGVSVSLLNTDMLGDITGTDSLNLTCDGYSWSGLVNAGSVLLPANYSRLFYDTGADQFITTLTRNGIAIATTEVVDVAIPGVRAGEWAIGTALDPVAIDYTFSFHHTTDGHVFFQVTNLSRMSTDFDEAFKVAVFHAEMAEVAAP